MSQEVIIRPFRPSDRGELEQILILNDQLSHPLVDGPDAMLRVSGCAASFFHVAEQDEKPIGLIRGNYDGSRAIINELSVHPESQRLGAGTRLVEASLQSLTEFGAPTTAVTVNDQSASFWARFGFEMMPTKMMLKILPEPASSPTSDCCQYIGQTLSVVIDRPVGSKHPTWHNVYPLNYGYLENTMAGDGDEQDVYIIGVHEPIERVEAVCIAVIHRADDDEDKLVATPDGKQYSDDQILALTEFAEQHFTSTVLRS